MNEYRLVTFCNKTEAFLPYDPGTATRLDIDFLGSVPELAQSMDGWEPIGFQVIPSGDVTYLSVMLRIENKYPDTAAGLI